MNATAPKRQKMIANEGDASLSPSPGAIRMRRWRQRGRDGSRLVTLQLTREAIGLLAIGGWVDPRQAENRYAIAEGLAKLVGTALYRRVPPRGWAPAEAPLARLANARQ